MTDHLCENSSSSTSTESDEKEAYARAIKLMARREHSRQELLLKLGKAGFDEISIDNTLKKLVLKGFQSDQRFAELFVEQRFNKGYGERDILAKLGQRGIDRHLAGNALGEFVSSANIDWYARAAEVLTSRFDLTGEYSDENVGENLEVMPDVEQEESAEDRRTLRFKLSEARQRRRKQWGNYLLRRGFYNDQVKFAIENPNHLAPNHPANTESDE